MKTRRFIDSAPLFIKAGNGGNGCVSFRREKYIPNGGPDGGDGGNGADVILKANRDETSLERLFFTPHQKAESGEPGKGKQLYGKSRKPLYISVPCGTEVRDKETNILLCDIVEHDQEYIVAHGGKGGKGNMHWKSSTHQAPYEHTDGEKGEIIDVQLILKLVADIGLVGFPNAGKSSLLTCISDAHPKIAAYPFTTLNPIIGTLIFEDYSRMTLADIPGLIEGAHNGIGLGHAFLRHIERANNIIYVIDMAAVDGRNPTDDYFSLLEELKLYKEEILLRKSFVIANKMDIPEAEDNLKEFIKRTGIEPIRVSTLSKVGLQDVRDTIFKQFTRNTP